MTMQRTAVRVSEDAYDVAGVLPDPAVESVAAGTSLLISGPSMTGKRALSLRLLAESHGVDVAVSSNRSARRLLDEFDRIGGDDLWVVDCSGASGKSSMDDERQVKYVNSPGDLTGIGIGIAKCTRQLGPRADDGLALSLLSLSTMLRYADERRVFNFLHVITGRVSAANYLGVATIDPSTHDDRIENVIRSQFDGVVELRDADDGIEGRVLGLADATRTWYSLEDA